MGLIRSGKTELTPLSEDADWTSYLWPVVREMIKTAVENGQHLIVEGCYIPFDWRRDYDDRTVYPDSLFGHQKKRPAGAGRQKETVASDEAWVTADPNTDPRRVTGPAGEYAKRSFQFAVPAHQVRRLGESRLIRSDGGGRSRIHSRSA